MAFTETIEKKIHIWAVVGEVGWEGEMAVADGTLLHLLTLSLQLQLVSEWINEWMTRLTWSAAAAHDDDKKK